MKKPTNGHGSLRRNGAVTELSMMGTSAYTVEEKGAHMVRIVMIGSVPGGCEAEVALTPEDAAQFASALYALARTAIIKNDRESVKEGVMPAVQAAA